MKAKVKEKQPRRALVQERVVVVDRARWASHFVTMNRRRFLKLLGLPALLASSGGAYAAWARSSNSYYSGPVSVNFDGTRFFNPQGSAPNDFGKFLRWQFEGGRAEWPETWPSPHLDVPPRRVEGSRLRVSYVGHASFLVQTAGLNILLDPVWSERASPVPFVGPKRRNVPGIAFEALPEIDLAIVSHNHYDHLDLPTLSRLRRNHPHLLILTPLGNDTIMTRHDDTLRVRALDWGDVVDIDGGVRVHAEPMHHWSARGMFDRRMALWAAFVIETPSGRIYFVGDSGYNHGAYFREARRKHGGFRLAILPIGAYEPRWFMAAQHMNPEEAVRAAQDCGAQAALAHHWGTFQLTNEAIEAPARDLVAALDRLPAPPGGFHALRPGQVYQDRLQRA
jgi:L-ascorbate metabolism protein UlaG (beta-lactamase superfamily)